jgi:predicted secreted Zn-dependent protease
MTVTINDPQWTTYDVHGHTLAEVAQYIETLAEAGQTQWHPSYHATRWSGNVIAAVQVDVQVTVSMPHWAEAATAPSEQQAEWERFIGALHTHEQGHIDLVTTYLQDVDTILENVTEQTAAQQWHDNLAALQQASDQYDAGNDHGRNEGTTITLPDEDVVAP